MAEADVVINDGPSQKRQKTLGDFFPGVALPPLQKDDPKCEFIPLVPTGNTCMTRIARK